MVTTKRATMLVLQGVWMLLLGVGALYSLASFGRLGKELLNPGSVPGGGLPIFVLKLLAGLALVGLALVLRRLTQYPMWSLETA